MRGIEIDKGRVKLAQVRYFDIERNASEIPEDKVYVVLINVNGTYINALNPFEELPVYQRTPYSNVTSDGRHEYGNKIQLVNGEEKDGVCFILELVDLGYEFRKDKVTIEDIENYVLNSKLFFKDRIKLLQGKRRLQKSLYDKKLLVEDMNKLNKFNEYISSYREEKVKKYKN